MPLLSLSAAPLAFLLSLTASILKPGYTSSPAPLSAWVDLHILVSLAAFAAFAVGFIAGLVYLIETRQLKEGLPPRLMGVFSSLEGVGRLNLHALQAGFLLLTTGLITGYLYARGHLGTGAGWRWDPKVVLTSLTWVMYGAILFLHAIAPAFRGRRAARASLLGFLFVLSTIWATVFWSDFHRFL
jgi:ABC-type uncharacterized transport system permease subunit